MTREEQIIEAGIDYTMSVRPMCVGGLEFEEEIDWLNKLVGKDAIKRINHPLPKNT